MITTQPPKVKEFGSIFGGFDDIETEHEEALNERPKLFPGSGSIIFNLPNLDSALKAGGVFAQEALSALGELKDEILGPKAESKPKEESEKDQDEAKKAAEFRHSQNFAQQVGQSIEQVSYQQRVNEAIRLTGQQGLTQGDKAEMGFQANYEQVNSIHNLHELSNRRIVERRKTQIQIQQAKAQEVHQPNHFMDANQAGERSGGGNVQNAVG